MKKVLAATTLALSLVLGLVGSVSAHPAHVAETCAPGGGHMVQLATQANIVTSPDYSFVMDTWVAEQFAGSVGCNIFQAVGRVHTNDWSESEPIGWVQLKITDTSYNAYVTNTWTNLTWTGHWPTEFVYYYSDLVYLGCPVGQIRSQMGINEAGGYDETYPNISDFDGGYSFSPWMYTC